MRIARSGKNGKWVLILLERIDRDGKQKLLISLEYRRVHVDGLRGFFGF
jgi:hypothetical protein